MQLALVLLAVLLSTLVIIAYLIFIWWLDRYEREPLWVVALVFLWGALGGTFFSCVINSLTGTVLVLGVGQRGGEVLTTVLVAPIVEEFMKALVFVGLIALGNQLDNKTDGLIYGAATGLGFACLENLTYYISVYDASQVSAVYATIVLRTLFSSLVHCASSALLGMAIGHAKQRAATRTWVFWVIGGYIAAIVCHGTWNGLATLTDSLSASDSPAWALGTMVFSMALMLGVAAMMFALTQISLHAEHAMIKRHLMLEAQQGVLPKEHALIIPYWLKRRRRDWLAPQIDKERYLSDATLLAFRAFQMELADGRRRHELGEELAELRRRVRGHHRYGEARGSSGAEQR